MKTRLFTPVLACVLFVVAHNAAAQQSLYGLRLQDSLNHILLIKGPLAGFDANYLLRLPPALPAASSLLYGDATGQLSWTLSGSNGQALLLLGGVPTWSSITNGTVTSFSFTNANGISGNVTNATTTPNLTLSLGAITPTSVNGLTLASQTNGFTIAGGSTPATLTVPLNASVSGTNTGDQTITLTSDVTGSGTGSFATTISNNAVTYAKMQAVSTTSRLLGSSQTTTPVQEISLGSGLTMTGTTLSATGLGGTVTSVGLSMPSGFSVSGSPVTTSGTLAVTTALSGVVHAGSGSFTAGQVDLSSEVVNILGAANGGTGLNTSATAAGSILYTSAAGTWATRPAGTNGYVLTMSGGFPDWVDLGTLVSTGWQLTGNSIISAWNGTTGSFLGTTNTQPLVIATTNTTTGQPIQFFTTDTERVRLTPSGQLGLGTTSPNTMLDVRKDFAMRGDTLTVTNGVQNDVGLNSSSNLRVYYGGSGTLRDTITGLAGGVDGKELRIFNTTHGIMTLTCEDSRSSAANRILTVDGHDLQIGDTGSVHLFYDSRMSRWIVRSTTRSIGGAATTGLASFHLQTAADTVFNSTTLSPAPALVITDVQPYQVMDIEGMLFVNADGNHGVVVSLDVPNDFNYFRVGVISFQEASNVSAGNDLLEQDNVPTITITSNGTKTTIIHLSGIYVNGPTKGDIQLRFAQGNASGWTAITIGSYLVGHKLQ